MAVAITPVPTNATYLDRDVSRIMTCSYNESKSRRRLDDKSIDDDSAEKKNVTFDVIQMMRMRKVIKALLSADK
jgi:hypothetical protein